MSPEKRVKFWESKLDEIKEKRDNALTETSHRMWGYMIHRVEKELQLARAKRAETIGKK